MTIVSCQCGQRFRAATHLAGQQVACPFCGSAIHVPGADNPFLSDAFHQSPSLPQTMAPSREFPTKLIVILGVAALLMIALIGGASILWTKISRSLPDDSEVAESDATPPNVARPPLRELSTPADLESSYRLRPGVPDGTHVWVAAGRELASEPYTSMSANVPIVGQLAMRVPAPGEPWPEQHQARALLRRYDRTIQSVLQAAEQGSGARYPTQFSEGIAMEMPEVQNAIYVGRLLTLASAVAAYDGEAHQAALALRGTLATAQSLDGYPAVVPGLVRVAIATQAEQQLLDMLPYVEFSDADLTMLGRQIEALQVASDLQEQLRGERVLGLVAWEDPEDTLVRLRSGELGGEPIRMSDAQLQAMKQAASQHSAADREYYLHIMNRALAAAGEPFPQFVVALDSLDTEFREHDGNEQQHVLSRLIVPPLSSHWKANGRAEALHRLTRAAIAVELFRREQDSLPQRLDQLTPTYLPSVPQDPFDGAPLRYEANSDSYLLYSVGYDRHDNHGQSSDIDIPDIARRIPIGSRSRKPEPAVASTSGPQVADASPREVVDLLATFKPPLPGGMLRGHWNMRNGVLSSQRQDRASYVAFPVEVPSNYRVTVDVETISGEGSFNLSFVVNGQAVMLVLDGWGTSKSGLNMVDRKTGDNNATTHVGDVLRSGQSNRVVLTVRGGQIEVTVNDQRIITWNGNSDRLSLDRRFWPVLDNRIYVGSWLTEFRVSRLELVALE